MPLSDYKYPAGFKVHAGDRGLLYHGTGRLYVANASKQGVDANLIGALKCIADTLSLSLLVSSLTTGLHVAGSRHYAGLAADLIMVGPDPESWHVCSLENEHAMRIVHLLLENGWEIGEHDPTKPGLLFGPVGTHFNTSNLPHANHLHLSLGRFRPDQVR